MAAEVSDREQLQQLSQKNTRFWFHAASSGEFEQIKPIIERLKDRDPYSQIVVTFFSPSGFEAHHTYPLADLILYLPLDTIKNVRLLLSTINPRCVVIARYDLWWNLIHCLYHAQIPVILVCATLNESSLAARIPFIKTMYMEMYSLLSAIYTAGWSETEKFRKFGVKTNIITAGDTRFDRIISMVLRNKQQPPDLIPQEWFSANDKIVVLGSSWAADEKIMLPAIGRLIQEGISVKVIVVPHNPNVQTIQKSQQYILEYLPIPSLSVLLSEIQNPKLTRKPSGCHIVVDSIGKLLQLYCYAHCAYIGGGFGSGVHSVTEPAGYGIPLAAGPNIRRARDAQYLQEQGALTVIRTTEECYRWLFTMLTNSIVYLQHAQSAHRYIHQTSGWSDTITTDILRISK